MLRGSFIGRFKHESGTLLLSLWNSKESFIRLFDKHYVDFFRHSLSLMNQ